MRMMVEAAGGLRVLLIQKDFKLNPEAYEHEYRLRVLLIQKDFKLVVGKAVQDVRLRVLLIQKDFKHLAQNQR